MCDACAPDTYTSTTGSTSCHQCDAGLHTTAAGSNASALCVGSSASLALAYGAGGGAGIMLVLVIIIIVVVVLVTRRRRRTTGPAEAGVDVRQAYGQKRVSMGSSGTGQHRDVAASNVDNPLFEVDVETDEFSVVAAHLNNNTDTDGHATQAWEEPVSGVMCDVM